MRRNGAFTLIELLVVVAIIGVLVTILIPAVMSGVTETHETVCATKLRTFGGAFRDYGNNIKTPDFPRMTTDGDVDDALSDSNELKVKDDNDNDIFNTPALGTNTMQNMWLLIDAGYLPAHGFQCPADGGYRTREANTKYGWTSHNEFSYGMQNPYNKSTKGDKTNEAVPADSDYNANWVLMADQNPGGKVDGATRFHSNHSAGFNYMSRIGNVAFHRVKDGSIVFGEEIYTDDKEDGNGYGHLKDDVIITPTDPTANRDD